MKKRGDARVMVREDISAEDAYVPPWHFKQSARVTEGTSMIFCNGLVGCQRDGTLAEPEPEAIAQADVAFGNMVKVATAAGDALADVVKTTVYIREDFREHRDALGLTRSRYFTEHYPAPTLIQVAGFANPDYLFQIEAMAVIN